MEVSGQNINLRQRDNWVAVIGSRNANRQELEFTKQFAGYLVEKGNIVVSGLASGIDAAAHEGALNAGGTTIAIVNTPRNQPIYPKQNRALADRIQKQGCIIHPYTSKAIETEKGMSHFSKRLIERDVFLARVCPKIVVIKHAEGLIEGGTRYGTHFGKQYGQDVMRIDCQANLFRNPETASAEIWWEMEMDIEKMVQKMETIVQ